MDNHVLYPELSYEIIGATMDVHNELGPGWDEWDYHRAMLSSLEKRGLKAESHLRKPLAHRAEEVDRMELDILVDGRVVLELKHIKTDFHPSHYTQIINYLKLWDKRLGLLINFGQDRLQSKRVLFSGDMGVRLTVASKMSVDGISPDISEAIRAGVSNVLTMHGAGYGAEVFRKILFAEFSHMELSPKFPSISPAFGSHAYEDRVVDAILLCSSVLLMVAANHGGVASQDEAILKSYLRCTDAKIGFVVNLGSTGVTLKGVS